jgi:hypothetical protein
MYPCVLLVKRTTNTFAQNVLKSIMGHCHANYFEGVQAPSSQTRLKTL